MTVVKSLDNKLRFLVTNKCLASETVSDHLFVANAVAVWDSLGARVARLETAGSVLPPELSIIEGAEVYGQDEEPARHGLEE